MPNLRCGGGLGDWGWGWAGSDSGRYVDLPRLMFPIVKQQAGVSLNVILNWVNTLKSGARVIDGP